VLRLGNSSSANSKVDYVPSKIYLILNFFGFQFISNITFHLATVFVLWANLYTENISFEYACLQSQYVGARRFETVVELVTAYA